MSQTISKNILLIMLSELREWVRFLVNWKEHRILREVSENYVPQTRTINGQPLTNDITIDVHGGGNNGGETPVIVNGKREYEAQMSALQMKRAYPGQTIFISKWNVLSRLWFYIGEVECYENYSEVSIAISPAFRQ